MRRAVEALRRAHSLLLVTHWPLDDDAIGSILSLTLSLRTSGCQATPLTGDPFPARYAFPPNLLTRSLPDGEQFDMPLALDIQQLSRTGVVYERCGSILESLPVLNIDHRGDNKGVGQINLVDPRVSSTAELVADLVVEG